MINGTPEDLDELVISFLTIPYHQYRRQSALAIKDFLAQRFGVAMIKETDPKVLAVLDELFKSITAEPKSHEEREKKKT